jgi:hypothetical protein
MIVCMIVLVAASGAAVAYAPERIKTNVKDFAVFVTSVNGMITISKYVADILRKPHMP